jgi:hypothetical protein
MLCLAARGRSVWEAASPARSRALTRFARSRRVVPFLRSVSVVPLPLRLPDAVVLAETAVHAVELVETLVLLNADGGWAFVAGQAAVVFIVSENRVTVVDRDGINPEHFTEAFSLSLSSKSSLPRTRPLLHRLSIVAACRARAQFCCDYLS